jgi:hypothetical protein
MSAGLYFQSKSLTIVGFFAVVFWQLASGFFFQLKTSNCWLYFDFAQ